MSKGTTIRALHAVKEWPEANQTVILTVQDWTVFKRAQDLTVPQMAPDQSVLQMALDRSALKAAQHRTVPQVAPGRSVFRVSQDRTVLQVAQDEAGRWWDGITVGYSFCSTRLECSFRWHTNRLSLRWHRITEALPSEARYEHGSSRSSGGTAVSRIDLCIRRYLGKHETRMYYISSEMVGDPDLQLC
jgi:hypothetical protein